MNRTALAAALVLSVVSAARAGVTYAGLVVFGDSLSDTGNIYEATRTGFATRRPAAPYYSPGRWTDGADNTAPANQATLQVTQSQFTGVWHERLADDLGIPRATPSRIAGGNGTNYAHGGATTGDGTDSFDITENMGYQVNTFLTNQGSGVIPTNRLYILWGGGNDLRDAGLANGATAATCQAAAQTAVDNIKNDIILLSQHIPASQRIRVLWPNVPPLQSIPEFLAKPVAARTAVQAGCVGFRTDETAAITSLATDAPNVDITPMDVYTVFGQLLAGQLPWVPANTTDNIVNAGSFSGLTFNPTRNPNVPNGVNPDTYVFWDQVHPTSRVHSVLGDYANSLIPSPSGLVVLAIGGAACTRRRRTTI